MTDSIQEQDIVRGCKEGDADAFRMVYDQYGDVLYRTALRMLRNREDAEDAVQTAFVKLYRGIGNFDGRSKLSTYLFRILVNVCLDLVEKNKKKTRSFHLHGSKPSATPAHDLRLTLEDAIGQLPPRQRACFILFAIEERQQTEIARILGLSVGGVKSNLYHAKRQLRAILSETEQETT